MFTVRVFHGTDEYLVTANRGPNFTDFNWEVRRYNKEPGALPNMFLLSKGHDDYPTVVSLARLQFKAFAETL